MSKHTPGPWRYDYEPGYCGEIISANGTFLCRFTDEPTADDARLIAAASELLEMLVEAANFIQPYSVGQELLERIDAAIAKATGEQP